MGRPLFRFAVLSAVAGVVLTSACRKDEPSQVVLPAGAVGRCESGIRRAVTKPTVKEVMEIYYDECADLYTEAGCRDAFHSAAHADLKEQVGIVMQGCRSAYCPLLGQNNYEACSDSFQVTPEAAMRAWPKLHAAVLAHEAGAYSGEVSNMLMALYAYTVKLGGIEQLSPSASASAGAPASAAPPGSVEPPGSAAPASSGAAPSPSGAAPAASGSSAPPAATKAKTTAKKP